MSSYYLFIGANSDIALDIYKKNVNQKYILIFRKKFNSKIRTGDYGFNLDLNHKKNYNKQLIKILIKFNISKIFLFHGMRPSVDNGIYLNGDIENCININFLSYAVILNIINSNTPIDLNEVIVFGSIAGDRGKANNPVYDSSKGAVHELSRGYRSIFKKKNINLMLVKPGNVITKMTKNIDKKFFWVSTNVPALDILKKLNKNKFIIYTPYFWRWIMFVIKIIPESVFNFLNLDKKNNAKPKI